MGIGTCYKKFMIPNCILLTSLFMNSNSFALNVNVGAILPLTGSQASFGKDTKNGIELALEELKGNNLTIKLTVEDSQSTPSESAKAINKLINSDRISVAIGEVTSSNTIAATSIAEKAKIPIISSSATNDTITFGKKYIFRACFIDSFQGVVMAEFAKKNLNASTAVILEDSDSDYSKGLSATFTQAFKKDGGHILKVIRYSQKDTTYTPQLSEVRKIKPDILFIPGFYQQVGVILREAKELQIKSKMLGGDGWDTPELAQIAKGAEIGSYISNHYTIDDNAPKLKSFVKAYTAKYNQKPSAMAALGYDTFNIVKQAILNANSDNSEKITAELGKIKDFQGVTGIITIDKNHNAMKPAVVLELTANGGYKYITSVAPPAQHSQNQSKLIQR